VTLAADTLTEVHKSVGRLLELAAATGEIPLDPKGRLVLTPELRDAIERCVVQACISVVAEYVEMHSGVP
jgi:hypothetical protein